jgi:hypothetical protein
MNDGAKLLIILDKPSLIERKITMMKKKVTLAGF